MPADPAAEAVAAVARALRRQGVGWYLLGAQAVIYWGRPRLSADVDVTVSVPPDRVGELAAGLAAEGFRPLVKGSSSPARSASRATTHWRCGLANSTARSTVVSTTATAPT